MFRLLSCSCLAIALCQSASAQGRVYAGEEAAALKCSYFLSFVSVFMENEGRLSTRVMEDMVYLSVPILDRHVSGTFEQKQAAQRQIGSRYGVLGTFEAFSQDAENCMRQFPV